MNRAWNFAHVLRDDGLSYLAQTGILSLNLVQLLLIGLATCSAINVVDLLEKMRQPFSALEIDVAGERAESVPRVWTDITLHYRVWGQVDERRLARAIWLSETKLCSAAAMLSPVANISHTFEILADLPPTTTGAE